MTSGAARVVANTAASQASRIISEMSFVKCKLEASRDLVSRAVAFGYRSFRAIRRLRRDPRTTSVMPIFAIASGRKTLALLLRLL